MRNNKRENKRIINVVGVMLIRSIYLIRFRGQAKPSQYRMVSRLDSLIKKSIPLFQFQSIFDNPKNFPVLF